MECFQIQQGDYGLIVVGRLFLALVLGGLVGLEREIHGRPAGFRAHVLVTMGACLMMMVSKCFYFISNSRVFDKMENVYASVARSNCSG